MENKVAVLINGGIVRIDKKLAVAAPDLLAALEWALKNLEEVAIPEFNKRGIVSSMHNAADKARAAIAKARGE